MTLIRVPFLYKGTVLPHRVYFREQWAGSWAEDAEMFCTQASWNANPTIPHALLTRRYGWAVAPAEAGPAAVDRNRTLQRWFVKIEFDTQSLTGESNPAPLKWYGVLEVDNDVIDGNVKDDDGNPLPSGRQFFQCYGLAFLLDRVIVSSSRVAGGYEDWSIGRGLDFNFDATPNRTENVGPKQAHLFTNDLDTTKRKWWSTKDAAEYLLAYHGPRDDNATSHINFELDDGDAQLPTWDHVDLPTQGQSTWELLNSLMSRQRLLGFKVEPNEDESIIYIKPFTFAGAIINLPEVENAKIAANANQITIGLDRAADCEVTLKRSTAELFDRVTVIGARRTSCCTLSFYDENIVIGWTDELETEYEEAASTAGTYPAGTEIEERLWRNTEARKSDRFKSVYAYFKLPDDWDHKAGDGLGGDQFPVFPRDDDDTKNATVYDPELFVLPRLRLLDGVDYSGANLQDGDIIDIIPPPHDRLHPVVLFPRFDSTEGTETWRTVEEIGMVANLESYGQEIFQTWSGRVEVPDNTRGLYVVITNDDQYVIAADDFTPLPEDPPFFPNDAQKTLFNFRKATYTVCLEWDHYADGTWPDVPIADQQNVRTLVLNLGAKFRCDYVVPGTAYGVDPLTGAALRSTSGGFVRDDRPLLKAIARMAYEWYSVLRRSLSFGCSQINPDFFIGQYVQTLETVGDTEEVNSIISTITIETGFIESELQGEVQPPKIRYETAFGELDQVKFVSTFAVRQKL